MMKQLKPIVPRESYEMKVADQIVSALYAALFKPLFDILNVKVPKRVNSVQDIKDAIRAGRIFWQEGFFYGTFNSKIAASLRALGAVFR